MGASGRERLMRNTHFKALARSIAHGAWMLGLACLVGWVRWLGNWLNDVSRDWRPHGTQIREWTLLLLHAFDDTPHGYYCKRAICFFVLVSIPRWS